MIFDLQHGLQQKLEEIYNAYIKHGSRSMKKSKIMNKNIIDYLQHYYPNNTFKSEQNISSLNYSNQKRCDICMYKNNRLHTIFPIKFVCKSYLKNRNNYFENLVGETYMLSIKNPEVRIVPINIFLKYILDDSSGDYYYMSEKQIQQQMMLYNNLDLFDDLIIIRYDDEQKQVKLYQMNM